MESLFSDVLIKSTFPILLGLCNLPQGLIINTAAPCLWSIAMAYQIWNMQASLMFNFVCECPGKSLTALRAIKTKLNPKIHYPLQWTQKGRSRDEIIRPFSVTIVIGLFTWLSKGEVQACDSVSPTFKNVHICVPKPPVLCRFNIHKVKAIFADTFSLLTLHATAITSSTKRVLQRGDTV